MSSHHLKEDEAEKAQEQDGAPVLVAAVAAAQGPSLHLSCSKRTCRNSEHMF